MKTILKKYNHFCRCSLSRSISLMSMAALLIFSACSSEDEPTAARANSDDNVVLGLRNVPAVFQSNILLYRFKTNNSFVERQLNLLWETPDTVSTNMQAGTWNLVMLTSDNSIASTIQVPAFGASMNSSILWKTQTLPGDSLLGEISPEFRYGALPNTTIAANTVTRTATSLQRNVAKIQVILTQSGFGTVPAGTNPNSFVELLDVPTTLAWNAGLYPNKTTPDISAKPMRKYMVFDAAGKADTLNFIVPAHRGIDAFTSSPTDTTMSKLRLRVSMPLGGQRFYGKSPAVIEFVPKVNRIMQIFVNFKGEPATKLDMKITVKDWENYIDQNEEFN